MLEKSSSEEKKLIFALKTSALHQPGKCCRLKQAACLILDVSGGVISEGGSSGLRLEKTA